MESRSAAGGRQGVWPVCALAAFAMGCGGNVVLTGGGEGGSGGAGGAPWTASTSGPTGTTGAGGDASAAIALTYAQLQAASGTGGFGANGSSGVGGGPDPETQFLMYGTGSEEPSCADPYGPGGCGGWNVSISVAPEVFQVGTWPLWEDGFSMSMLESFDEGGNVCSVGAGGGLDEGELEIIEITDATVRFRVTGLAGGFSFDPTGTFVAQRCP